MKTQIIASIFIVILCLSINISFAQSGNYKQQNHKSVPDRICSNFNSSDLLSGNYKQSTKVNDFATTACCDHESCMQSHCCSEGVCTQGCCNQNHVSADYKHPGIVKQEGNCSVNVTCSKEKVACCCN